MAQEYVNGGKVSAKWLKGFAKDTQDSIDERVVAVWIYPEQNWRLLLKSWWDKLLGPKPNYAAVKGSVYFIRSPNDGCSKSPDQWRGKIIWPACVIHDFHYRTGAVTRRKADARFRKNIAALLRMQGMNRFSAWLISRSYFRAVSLFGSGSFHKNGNNK